MQVDDLTVEVRTRDMQRVGIITSKELDLEFVLVHNNVGTWKLTLSSEHPMCAVLRQPGAGIVVSSRGAVLGGGPMESPEESASPEDRLGMVIFEGVDDNVILQDATAWPEPDNSDVTTQTVSHDERTGACETLMHEYVSANIGTLATAERKAAGLSEGADEGRGPTVTKKARFPTLGELCAELSAAAGGILGFRVVQSGQGREFQTYETQDRSREIRLTIENKRVAGQKVKTTAPGVTRAIVAGGGQLVDRVFVERSTTLSEQAEADWGRRIERFVDQRNTVDTTELNTAGDEVLVEGGFTGIGVQIVPAEDTALQFGTDWFLGDIVTVEVDGAEQPAVITGAVLKADSDGVRLGLALGEISTFASAGNSTSGAPLLDGVSLLERISNLEREGESALTIDTGWTAPTFLNSWVNYGAGGWSTAAYRKVGNRVYLRGLVKDGTLGAAVFTLPSGYRPTAGLHFGVICSDTTVPGKAQVLADGSVVASTGANSHFSLDEISFFVD